MKTICTESVKGLLRKHLDPLVVSTAIANHIPRVRHLHCARLPWDRKIALG